MSNKFVASYSGGKDSALALYRAIRCGYKPIALITTYNVEKIRTWFHGLPQAILQHLSKSLGIPIWQIETDELNYGKEFEQALIRAKALGTDFCVFGDIDIVEHHKWCSDRCQVANLSALFPLWGEERAKLVYEFIDSGFTAHITVVDCERLDPRFLGEKLTRPVVEMISSYGVDMCGENGEFHTFVSAGPILISDSFFFD